MKVSRLQAVLHYVPNNFLDVHSYTTSLVVMHHIPAPLIYPPTSMATPTTWLNGSWLWQKKQNAPWAQHQPHQVLTLSLVEPLTSPIHGPAWKLLWKRPNYIFKCNSLFCCCLVFLFFMFSWYCIALRRLRLRFFSAAKASNDGIHISPLFTRAHFPWACPPQICAAEEQNGLWKHTLFSWPWRLGFFPAM